MPNSNAEAARASYDTRVTEHKVGVTLLVISGDWVASCDCGWHGPRRLYTERVREDAIDHLRAIELGGDDADAK